MIGARMFGALGVFLLLSGGVVVATAQQVGATNEFSVVGRDTNIEWLPAGGTPTLSQPASPSIGDKFILREDLLQDGTNIGFDNIICTDTFNNNALCEGVFAITGKGDIHATALIRNFFDFANEPASFDAAIDGGTFAYAHASGSIHFVPVNSTDSAETFVF
jgi:hypothetical protein